MTFFLAEIVTHSIYGVISMEMLKGKTKVLWAETMTELFSFEGREVSLCANANRGKQNV